LLPFKAVHNNRKRFEVSAKPVHTITGRWAVSFEGRNNTIDSAVGEFHQQGSYLTGTFLTPAGDYRFLEGVVNGDSLKLSGFDGSFAFSFVAKIENANTISHGVFYSGATGKRTWSAIKDANAKLPESFSGTALQGEEQKLLFSFAGLDGQKISNDDARFNNKVLVIQLLGSWCPNCIDETKFLSQYYSANKHKGIELLGLAYERKADPESTIKALRPLLKRFNVQYPVALSGVSVSDSLRAEKTLPQVGKINAFPTTIFVDKKGYLRKIHSGFNGPATGEHYGIYKKEFEATIEELLNE
jgi:thiol-disulfide isomerase/thioredoxin